MQAAEQPAAETLLTAFTTIDAAERRKHASVLNYWLSIRGSKEFPPLHDFDPLEISDFGQSSMLVEIMGGGRTPKSAISGRRCRRTAWSSASPTLPIRRS